ncbi:MAG: efflux RND transporter permease subunit [Mariprofundaceae bacterium]|nr:efflux RND transporter permease subunit [Mariprofundaceae bacterium]
MITPFIRFFIQRGLLVNMMSVLLLLGGIYAALHIQREAFPSINFDQVVITAAYPGASPEEVAKLVLTPIERQLKSVEGINNIHSVAYAGSMQMNLEIDPDYQDRTRFVSDVEQAINRAALPKDLATDPLVVEIKSDQVPVLSFTVFSKKEMDDLSFKRLLDQIEDDLLELEGVARVLVQGTRKEEIRITLDPQKMHQYRISTQDVMQLILGWNVNAPGGEIQTAQGSKSIRIAGEFSSAQDAAQLVLRANDRGDVVYLSDVATVQHTLERPRRYVDSQGKTAINVIVQKKGREDIISLVDRVRDYLDTIPQQYGAHLEVHRFQDMSNITRLRLGVLTSNGLIGLVFVFVILLLFLRPAVALTTAWGLPIIFFSGLLVIFFWGETLNLLAMFGFIIVLGLMVDDAIIIGENITYHMEKGLGASEAAIVGTVEMVGPVTATVLTTMIAFLPLMFMDGIIGKFVAVIPFVVIVLLAFSWLESIFILPNHIVDVVHEKYRSKQPALVRVLTKTYQFVLEKALKLRYLTVLITLLVFIASLGLASQMKFTLFPGGAEDAFYIQVSTPEGTSLLETRQYLRQLDTEVRQRIPAELLETTTSVVGENSADQRDNLKLRGDRYGFLRVILVPFNTRSTNVASVLEGLEKDLPTLFPALKLDFKIQKGGPPVGRAFEAHISGASQANREETAKQLIQYLQGISGVYSIESGLDAGNEEIHVVLDRAKAAYAGIDLATVATHIKVAFDGLVVSTLRKGTQEIDISLRYPEISQKKIETLQQLLIPNKQGGLVALHHVAHFESSQGVGSVRHKNGAQLLIVSAQVDENIITSKALNDQVKKDQAIWQNHDALRIHFGGEEERSEESVRSLMFSFLFALVGIFMVLAIQFNRLSYPLLVMFSIPFGVIGIVVGFYLHGHALSFMALMGLVALSGVVVNNALVMAVFIQRLLAEGEAWRDAIIQGAVRRFRAVLLTTLTTVLGLLPTAYGWGGLDPFVAPMALALSWGLIFSTFITLFTIPAMLGISLDVKHLCQAVFQGRWLGLKIIVFISVSVLLIAWALAWTPILLKTPVPVQAWVHTFSWAFNIVMPVLSLFTLIFLYPRSVKLVNKPEREATL